MTSRREYAYVFNCVADSRSPSLAVHCCVDWGPNELRSYNHPRLGILRSDHGAGFKQRLFHLNLFLVLVLVLVLVLDLSTLVVG